MSQVKFSSVCPECGKDILLSADIPDTSKPYPRVRGGLEPVGDILVYRISSEQIKEFLIQKARHYVPDVMMTIVPRYIEKKRRNNNDPHRSYASFRIAFSDHVIEKKQDLGWFGSIGENGSNVKLHDGIMKGMIDKYKFNLKNVEAWLKSYKILENLEDSRGITEPYINDIRQFATPRRIIAENNEPWIIFAAAAENIINDMLTDVNTGKINGRIHIHDIYPISNEIVEFVVYIHPSQMKTRENPHVRQILLGESKPKK